MAFKTIKPKREPASMQEIGARIAARRAELGMPDHSAHPELVEPKATVGQRRNSGERRTPSKRALLKAIEDAGGKW